MPVTLTASQGCVLAPRASLTPDGVFCGVSLLWSCQEVRQESCKPLSGTCHRPCPRWWLLSVSSLTALSLRFRPALPTRFQFTCWIFLFPLDSAADTRLLYHQEIAIFIQSLLSVSHFLRFLCVSADRHATPGRGAGVPGLLVELCRFSSLVLSVLGHVLLSRGLAWRVGWEPTVCGVPMSLGGTLGAAGV